MQLCFNPPAAPQAPLTGHLFSTPLFEYVGSTSLTVIGPVSGRTYRFARPLARQLVDPRDRAALAAMPQLRPLQDQRRPR